MSISCLCNLYIMHALIKKLFHEVLDINSQFYGGCFPRFHCSTTELIVEMFAAETRTWFRLFFCVVIRPFSPTCSPCHDFTMRRVNERTYIDPFTTSKGNGQHFFGRGSVTLCLAENIKVNSLLTSQVHFTSSSFLVMKDSKNLIFILKKHCVRTSFRETYLKHFRYFAPFRKMYWDIFISYSHFH